MGLLEKNYLCMKGRGFSPLPPFHVPTGEDEQKAYGIGYCEKLVIGNNWKRVPLIATQWHLNQIGPIFVP